MRGCRDENIADFLYVLSRPLRNVNTATREVAASRRPPSSFLSLSFILSSSWYSRIDVAKGPNTCTVERNCGNNVTRSRVFFPHSRFEMLDRARAKKSRCIICIASRSRRRKISRDGWVFVVERERRRTSDPRGERDRDRERRGREMHVCVTSAFPPFFFPLTITSARN